MSIKIGNLKNSQVLEAAEEAKIKADKYEEGEITDETSEESTKLLIKTEMETTSGDYFLCQLIHSVENHKLNIQHIYI